MTCVVYGLSSSEDGVIRYIGQTVKAPERRLLAHKSQAKRRRTAETQAKINAASAAACRGRPKSAEERAKISASKLGKKINISDERREQLRMQCASMRSKRTSREVVL